MATGESSQTKTRQRGGALEGELEEKGLDGKDRQREGYKQPIKKHTESIRGKARLQIEIRSGFKCSLHWLGNNNSSTRREDTEKGGSRRKMDVQTENTDPPPCESQSSGKIRKGFKLFGKRKPGNIFSIRSKGDGNNKSPVIRSSTTIDGLSETGAPDSEPEQDKEKGQEGSQGGREQAEEEPLGEDGVLAAAPARASISSACSVKSLSFLSMLRGGRRGVGDRRVHTVSQPSSRQRRGLKGLFGNVRFRSKDKEEETPPSPLLMSSRSNSVEIIKEDLTLTPKSQPRSLNSPVSEKSLTTEDSATTSPSETLTLQVTAGHVSRTNEHAPPLPTSEPPLVPGDNSLSCLLADISSLLTFDSISGGGDIMADVEAEWGKASSPISAAATEFPPPSTSLFSKPTISSSLTCTTKPCPVAVPKAALTQSITPLTTTASTSSPIAKPSSIITTLTKSSTLTTHSVKLSLDSTQLTTPASIATKPSTTPVTLTSLSAPMTTFKPTLSSTYSATTAPPNTPATVVKAPSISSTLTCTASKLASEIVAPPENIASVSKAIPVATPTPPSAKPPPVTQSPPIPVALTQPPSAKSDSAWTCKTSTSYKPFLNSAVGESKPSSPSETATVPTSTATSGSVSAALSKPTFSTSPMNLNKAPSSLVSVPDMSSSSTPTTTTRTHPSPASVPTPSSTSLDKIPPTTKPSSAPFSLNKMPPAYTPTPTPATRTVVSTVSPTPPPPGLVPVSQSKAPPAQILITLPKDPPAQMQVSQSKAPTVPAQIPALVSKDPPAPAQMPVSVSKAPPAPAQILVSVSKAPPAPAQIPVSVSKAPPAPAQIPVSVSKAPPAPAQISVSVSKDPPAPAQISVSVSKDPPAPAQISVSVSKDPPAPAQIPVSVSKAPPAPAQIPVSVSKDPPALSTSILSTPATRLSEAQASAKNRGSGQTSVDGQLISLSSTGAQGSQIVPSRPEELHNESRMSLQGPPRESRIPQVKASGLSKIPVVGGGRAGKLPVRDSQHVDEETIRDPPTPVLEEERPSFNSHDAWSKDRISEVEANVPTSKHTQEESQQLPQPKVFTALPRDSKIPVKHGAQCHTASHIPQAKEPSRTKIPVSKVPVRRAGNKPAAPGGSTQMRK